MRTFGFFYILLYLGCASPDSGLEEMDLMSYGIPIVIKAPPGAEVKVTDLGVWKDITVQSGEDYFVQIISSEATNLDAEQIKMEKMRDVKSEPFFSKIIQEDEHGFMYEKNIDSTIDYDFRHIRIQGNSEYIFQTGLFGTFSEEQVRRMYASVQ